MALRPVAAALAGVLLLLAPRLRAQHGLEYEVKAAYLYNIVNFVTWPPDAFAGPADPLHVCVVGPDPFGPLLDRAMAGGTANMRPVAVDRVADAAALTKCHLVFVTGADRIEQVVRNSRERPVLTVGEAPDFLRRGGMIALTVDGGRVRFDVNLPAASARGLALSSRLLQVARTVVGKGQPG
jgi:YfiR/HmsC-like